MKKLISILLCVALVASLAAGCGAKTETPAATEAPVAATEAPVAATEAATEAPAPEKTKIVLGTQVSYEEMVNAAKENFEAMGYEVEITMFDNTTTPNIALEEGSIDANFFQHTPFMNSFNEGNGGHLVALEPGIMHSVYALYSQKYDSLEALPDGAVIGIPGDPSNQSVNLEVLRDAGVITLKDVEPGQMHSLFDIVDNPHNYQFVEAELGALAGLYPDVDAMLTAAITFYKNGYDISNPLAINQDYSAYPMIIAVREENADAQWAKDLAKAFTAEGMSETINEVMNGTFISIF